ncbi:MAG TPA: alpha/beta fold hydrolase [Longimicrobium sp.]|nr:alpha/beta fold hydrolase [Longimicrobium sp.]
MSGRPILIVPGWTNSGPEHWQSRWEREMPGCRRVQQRDWDHPDRGEWIAALDNAVRAAPAPPVLVAHSLGCLAVAWWAAAFPAPVHGALLVAPVDVEQADTPAELRSFGPVPIARLPFPSTVVASRSDPYAAFDRARAFAEAWGARLVDAGDAGHLNAASGHGPWPQGERLLRELLEVMGTGERGEEEACRGRS